MSSHPGIDEADRAGAEDRSLPGGRAWGFAGLCLVAALALRVLARFPTSTEGLYARGGGSRIAEALAAGSALLPFSLAELAMFGGGLAVLIRLALWLRPLIRRQRGWKNALRCAAPWLIGTPAVLVLSFDVSWGLNYGRPPLLQRLAWRPAAAAAKSERIAELEGLARGAADRAIAARAELRSSPLSPPQSWAATARDLDEAYNKTAAPLLGEEKKPGVPAPKRMLAEGLMARLGVAGFYFPWTGETHVDFETPAFELPHIIAHEQAHARGTASEDEANFLGFLACAASEAPLSRYSGWMFAWRQLQSELSRLDPERSRALYLALPAPLREDLAASAAYYRRYSGALSTLGQAINDQYLKANAVKDGVGSYRRSVAYLILYGRRARLTAAASPSSSAPPSAHEARER